MNCGDFSNKLSFPLIFKFLLWLICALNIKQTQQIDSRLQAALAGEREELAQLRRAAAKLAEAHKTEEAKAVFAELQKFVQDNELTLRKTYDIFLNYATLKQKLHLNQ